MSTTPENWLHAFRLARLGLDDDGVRRLAEAFREQSLAPSECLVRQGDEGDSLFLVVEGKLAVLDQEEMTLRELGPGDLVGEIALLVGGKRSATVRALAPTRVLALTRERLDALVREGSVKDNAEISAAFSRALGERLRRSELAAALRELFGELDTGLLTEIEGRVTWVHLASGEELFRKGDAPDGAYIVALGRLRVATNDPDGAERVIDEVGHGEWVGEMALLARKERSATVYALRDTELIWISQAVFDDLMVRYPRVLLETSRVLVLRLQRQLAGRPQARRDSRTFAIVPCNGDVDIEWFVTQLSNGLARHGSLIRLNASRVDAELGKSGIARAERHDPAHLRLSAWLMRQEQSHDFVVYEADPGWSEWTDRAARHADHILFVGDGTAGPDLGESEVHLAHRAKAGRTAHRTLVLLQPDGAHAYPGTSRWLDRREVSDHHHVRRGRIADVERVARILSKNAIGLVFGGGGSRGYAHIGVVRAFEELGIPIDTVGGTSMGGVVALMRALEYGSEKMLRTSPAFMQSAFFDPTLPVVSLMRGTNTLAGVAAVAGGLDLEDFVLPLFVVSTNLTRGDQVVHRRGEAVLALRATGSVPGIFPPVPWNGDLLVDGGLSNNVPVDVMRSLFPGKTIGVDVIPDVELFTNGELPPALSGWKFAWHRLNPFAKRIDMPNILSILMRSATASSRGLRPSEVTPDCLYLRPSVSRWNIIDFSAAEPLADEGYHGTVDAIRAWWTSEGASLLGRSAGRDAAPSAKHPPRADATSTTARVFVPQPDRGAP